MGWKKSMYFFARATARFRRTYA